MKPVIRDVTETIRSLDRLYKQVIELDSLEELRNSLFYNYIWVAARVRDAFQEEATNASNRRSTEDISD